MPACGLSDPRGVRRAIPGGTRAPGPLTELGRALMPQLERAGMILDASHMAEQSFWDALELYHGTVIASHSNCRAYIGPDADRQLSDEMIRAIAQRNGVIGVVMFNRFIRGDWDKSKRKGRGHAGGCGEAYLAHLRFDRRCSTRWHWHGF